MQHIDGSPIGGVSLPLLTERQARESLGLKKDAFRDLVRSGEIPFILIGKRRYYDPADLRAYRERSKRTWNTKISGTGTTKSTSDWAVPTGIETIPGAVSAIGLASRPLTKTKPRASSGT